ncbi:hypothetical protein NEOLI_004868 [Neolecta irregularis DAH-3]|uniref:Uncharacterized protein n=1 Tax=Neolecta irregularis (strain DAH-3) TaxID=1198029 RepID=A0A1U7LMF2_NEOID|nr:hypothetical protein NEOLI_004868 [Neolecta irregularis DAH-3]|eukprot:OLL23834.1 hypothetical protein NEOLI_004868 [Neolecta irregularis DAH-3]
MICHPQLQLFPNESPFHSTLTLDFPNENIFNCQSVQLSKTVLIKASDFSYTKSHPHFFIGMPKYLWITVSQDSGDFKARISKLGKGYLFYWMRIPSNVTYMSTFFRLSNPFEILKAAYAFGSDGELSIAPGDAFGPNEDTLSSSGESSDDGSITGFLPKMEEKDYVEIIEKYWKDGITLG